MAPFSPDYQPVTVANQSGQFITINLENASGGFPYYEGTLLRITAIRFSDGVTRTDVTINQHTYTPDHLEYSPTGPGAVEVINPWNTDGNTPTAATFIVERISEPLQTFSPDPGEMVNLNALEAQLNAQLEVLQELRAKIYGYGNPLAGADVIQSVHGFTIPSKLVRALKFVKFDAIGDLDLVAGPDWSEIINKPSTFPPSAHTHTWSEIQDKPLTFPPVAHGHPFSDISGNVPWDRIVDVPNDLGGASDWPDITNKPLTFPPSAHDHAGDNLGNPTGSAPETPNDRRVQTLFANTLDIPSTGTFNIANARLFPVQGGDLFKFQIWDSVTETHVDAMTMAYDPNAAQPLASLVHYCPGSVHAGFRLVFGAPAPDGLDNPYFRADDIVAGAPFENDAVNLYFNNTGTYSFTAGGFYPLNSTSTLGTPSAPWASIHGDNLALSDGTALLPSITFAGGDANCGIYLFSANTVGVSNSLRVANAITAAGTISSTAGGLTGAFIGVQDWLDASFQRVGRVLGTRTAGNMTLELGMVGTSGNLKYDQLLNAWTFVGSAVDVTIEGTAFLPDVQIAGGKIEGTEIVGKLKSVGGTHTLVQADSGGVIYFTGTDLIVPAATSTALGTKFEIIFTQATELLCNMGGGELSGYASEWNVLAGTRLTIVNVGNASWECYYKFGTIVEL